MNRSEKSVVRKTLFAAAFSLPMAFASVALAQPAVGEVPVPVADAQPTGAVDEAKLNELVDRRVAKLLEERAAKSAAQDAAKAAAEKDSKPLEGNGTGETGGNGVVDIRLNFTCGHENVLVQPGETIPSIPGFRCGVPKSPAILFFDNYDTRFNGFENLDHQVMYKQIRKGHIEAEGALVLRTQIAQDQPYFDDGGSYLTVAWWQDAKQKSGKRIRFTGFPNSSDRFRLGYSYRLSWGGNEDFQRGRQKPPGFKVQYDDDKAYAFVGVKTSLYLDPDTKEELATSAVLAGAGVDITDMARIEINGGYFARGNNELQDVTRESVQLFGASAQLSLHKGMPVQSSIDYRLYKFDADRAIQFFQRAKYPGGLSWLLMTEATLLGQTLKDPEKTGSTTIQFATAGDVNIRVMLNRIRLRFDAQYRSLEYVLHSVPSLPTYSAFPKEYTPGGDIFAAAGIDKNWNDSVTVGVQAGVERPAILTTPASIPGGSTSTPGRTTAVIRSIDRITVLPVGESAVPMFALKLTGQIDFNKYFAVVGNAFFTYDGNQTRLKRDNNEGLFSYEFGNFNQFGFNVTLQARI